MRLEQYSGGAFFAFSLVLAAVVQPTHAEQNLTAESCAQLQDKSARLACFDQVFGTTAPAIETDATRATLPTRTTSEARIERGSANELSMEELTIVTPTASPDPVADTEAKAFAPASLKKGSGGLLTRRDKVNFESKVRSVRARDKQRMVFLLENGEVWMQSSPRNLAIKEGHDVSIKSGLFGGYMLRTSNGISTRVTRIR